jgi:Spy/CpxP family protein refolding chaperone
MRSNLAILAALLLLSGAAWSQQAEPCPMHEHHMGQMGSPQAGAHAEGQHAGMSHPGDQAMGFSPTAITRHFLIIDDGGSMVIEANDPADAATRDAVRAHLATMAKALAAGDFSAPSFVNQPTAPGAATVQQLASQIRFTYMDTERGGQVHVSTDSSEARAAIHQLIEFQIQQHHTQDAVPQSPVKTVSADEAQGLLKGEGMGMAKAAELNHYPGPRHVLQLATDLHLTPGQTAATQALFDSMHQTAVSLGEEILAREKTLDELFAGGQPSAEEVSAQVSQIAVLEGRLRAAHLLTHLKQRQLLQPEQVAAYDKLRHGPGAGGEHSHTH